MPRDGSNVYHRPPGIDAVTNTTISSVAYNTNVQDVESDLNLPRPIVAGGTGANNAAQAMQNLGGELAKQSVSNYDATTFQAGSFYSATSATGAPVAGHAFNGICYVTDANNMTIEARDQTNGNNYVRIMTAGVWGSWAADVNKATADAAYVLKAGDNMTGNLGIAPATTVGLLAINPVANSAQINLNKSASGQNSNIYGLTNSKYRWMLNLGDSVAESGSNAGSNFGVYRANDAGTLIDAPFQIVRSTGAATFTGTLTVSGIAQFNSNVTVIGQMNGQGQVLGTPNISAFSNTAGGVPSVGCWNNARGTNLGMYNASDNSLGFGTMDGSGNVSVNYVSINTQLFRTSVQNGITAYTAVAGAQPAVGCYSGARGNNFGIWSRSDSMMGCGSMDGTNVPLATYAYWRPGDSAYVISGPGYKPGGGVWADSSDARIKTVTGAYESGLDAILALNPVTFTFKGNDTHAPPEGDLVHPNFEARAALSAEERAAREEPTVPYANSSHRGAADSQQTFIGLIAQEAEIPMPELVSMSHGYIDGVEVDDLREIDNTPLIFALVNAVKTLAARVEALEAR